LVELLIQPIKKKSAPKRKRLLAMPRTKDANQRIREKQREKILNGAREAFASKGEAATMAEVARAAGVSQGLVYHYFADKEEIFQELTRQIIHTDPMGVRRVAEEAGTPWERIASLISRLMESRRLYPEFYQLMDQVRHSEKTPANLLEQMRRQGEIFHETMRQLIIEGQAEGSVAAGDPDQLLMAVSIWLEGLNRWKFLDPQRIDAHWPDVRIALRMLKPEADERKRLPYGDENT
jgi:AcrR family transcriptional regulator